MGLENAIIPIATTVARFDFPKPNVPFVVLSQL